MDTVVISLGGSIIVPDEINVKYLKNFRKLITKHLKRKRFIIVAGGGNTARKYQKAAAKILKVPPEDLDWIGIHATRLNAHLLRTIFRNVAYPRILKDPKERVGVKEKVIIAAGWRPGCSTDYNAVILAKSFKTKTILNLTKQAYVYDKDPTKYKNAKPIKEMKWKELRKIVGDKWKPGLSMPFDPIAAKESEKSKLKVIVMGPSLKNLDKYLSGKSFAGTVIH